MKPISRCLQILNSGVDRYVMMCSTFLSKLKIMCTKAIQRCVHLLTDRDILIKALYMYIHAHQTSCQQCILTYWLPFALFLPAPQQFNSPVLILIEQIQLKVN